MNKNEKEAVSRIANSPLKFHHLENIENASIKSEPTQERDTGNVKGLEINITDGFDFGDSLK